MPVLQPSKEDILKLAPKRELEQWEIYDYADIAAFNIFKDTGLYDKSYFIKWPSDNTVKYQKNYMLRNYMDCCELGEEYWNDTNYELTLDKESLNEAENWWDHNLSFFDFKYQIPFRILLQGDNIDNSILEKILNYRKDIYLLNNSKSLKKNLAIISRADLVITRFGGCAIMAASVRTPTICLPPKSESPFYAHPFYSHPLDSHVPIFPEETCYWDYYAKEQPCWNGWGKLDFSKCPLKLEKHCSNSVTFEQIKEILDRWLLNYDYSYWANNDKIDYQEANLALL
jgi:hypothetical protein